jgi:hypothetical protein
MRVLLDPGHGEKDLGAVGNGLEEKDLTLAIATQVSRLLEPAQVTALFLRTEGKYVELSERTAMANRLGAHAFGSVPINSAESTAARGVEIYSYPGSAEGGWLARAVAKGIISYLSVQPALALKPAPKGESNLAWEWAKAGGLLDGTRPGDPVTRQDFAVVLKWFADKTGLKL